MSKKKSAAWKKAKAARSARRQRLPEQPRNEQGYIVKTVVTPSGATREELYDPGEQQRELYLKQRRQRQHDSWEAPIG